MAPVTRKKNKYLPKGSSRGWGIPQIVDYLHRFNVHQINMDEFNSLARHLQFDEDRPRFDQLNDEEHKAVLNKFQRYVEQYKKSSMTAGKQAWQRVLNDFPDYEIGEILDNLKDYNISVDELDAADFKSPTKRSKASIPKKQAKLPAPGPKPVAVDFSKAAPFEDFIAGIGTQDRNEAGRANPEPVDQPDPPESDPEDIFADSPRSHGGSDFAQSGTADSAMPSQQEEAANGSLVSNTPQDEAMEIQDSGLGGMYAAGQGSSSGGDKQSSVSYAASLSHKNKTPTDNIGAVKFRHAGSEKNRTFPYICKQFGVEDIGDEAEEIPIKNYIKGKMPPKAKDKPTDADQWVGLPLYTTHLASYPVNALGKFLSRVEWEELCEYAYIDTLKITVKPWSKRTPFNTGDTATGTANSQMDCFGSVYIGQPPTNPSFEFRYEHNGAEPCVPTKLRVKAFPRANKTWYDFTFGQAIWNNAAEFQDLPTCMGIPRQLPLYLVLWVNGLMWQSGDLGRNAPTNEYLKWYNYVREFDFDAFKGKIIANYHHEFKMGLIKYKAPKLGTLHTTQHFGDTNGYVSVAQGSDWSAYEIDAVPPATASKAISVGRTLSRPFNHNMLKGSYYMGKNLMDYEQVTDLPIEKCAYLAKWPNGQFDSNDAPPGLYFGVKPIQSNVSNSDTLKWAAIDVEWMVEWEITGHSYKHIPGMTWEQPHNLLKYSIESTLILSSNWKTCGNMRFMGGHPKLYLPAEQSVQTELLSDRAHAFMADERKGNPNYSKVYRKPGDVALYKKKAPKTVRRVQITEL